MINPELNQQIIIAGPCAAESRSQVMGCARELKEMQIDGIRTSLWKPRTSPGFEGVGVVGIPWLVEVMEMGLIAATEVLLPKHVTAIVEIVNKTNVEAQLLLWLGSRNQNHFIQRQIAKRLLHEGPNNALLMIKNQPWEEEKHWLGILDHVLQTGFPEKRILLCHRGFAPGDKNNPHNLRNLPNFDMAMKVREKTQRPMILDPSHIGGSVENVLQVIQDSLAFSFDGLMIEVHPDPTMAATDAKQQLNVNQLKEVLKLIKRKEVV